MKITDFVNSSQSKRLDRVRKAKTKEERRILEEKLLKPEELPPYTLESSKSINEVNSKTVTLVFENIHNITLLSKHFKISEYKGKNIRASNLPKMVAFLKALENNELVYDEKTKNFKCFPKELIIVQKRIKKLKR